MSDRPRAGDGGDQDRDWATLIRAELESYRPERLPARFQPRGSHAPVRGLGLVRPLAVGFAVVVLGVGVASVTGAPEFIQSAVQQLAAGHAAPTPMSIPSPSASAQPTAPAVGTVGAGRPSGSAQRSGSGAGGMSQQPGRGQPSEPTPAPAPTPSHSPSGIVLPLPSPLNCLPVVCHAGVPFAHR